MKYEFDEVRRPVHIENAWGRELIDEGMRHYVGDYRWLPQYDVIVEWLSDNKCRGLLCVGDYGLGKTLICERILPAMFRAYAMDCMTVSAYEMSGRIEEMKRHGIVVIDDVGVEGEAVIYGERRNIFNEMVDYAEKNGVLLILTSNLTVREMQAKYGVRTVDRLSRITRAVVFQGESLR